MGIEKITERIISEAETEAVALKKAAESEAESAKKAAEEEAAKLKAELSEKAKEDSALVKERRAAVAELEAKKELLAAKQEMIEQSFSEAVRKLAELPEDKYLDYLEAELSGEEGGELLLSERDRARIGEKLIERLNAKKPGKFTLSAETADIAGGFILRNGDVSVNGSFEAAIDDFRKELTGAAARILFGEKSDEK